MRFSPEFLFWSTREFSWKKSPRIIYSGGTYERHSIFTCQWTTKKNLVQPYWSRRNETFVIYKYIIFPAKNMKSLYSDFDLKESFKNDCA